MKRLDTRGFSAIEALLIFVMVGVVCAVGLFVYNSQKKTDSRMPDKANTSQKTGVKRFEDKEHGFLFEYPQDLEVESSSIWGDKPQGGLEIWVYKPGAIDADKLDEPAVLESEGVIARISVINTDIDKVAKFSEFLKPDDNKKQFTVCEEQAISFSTDANGKDVYATEFQKNNLYFGIDTFVPNSERIVIHDSIIKSITCL